MTRRASVGVVGGVGPAASVYFLERVVALTEAASDQDHVEMVVMHATSIPDRTAFLLGRSSEDPGPALAATVRALERAGVDVVVVPCNTADAFGDDMAAVGIPVVSIVQQAVAALAERTTSPVGVLATDGTLAAGTYRDALAAAGLAAVVPEPADQATVMEVIYDQVKAGRPVDADRLAAVVDRLRGAGAEHVVLGCTELSVGVRGTPLAADERLLDPVDTLARYTIRHAGHTVREPATG